MDFFSGNEIVLLIWGIGILHFIFRWMKERRSSDRSTEGTPREENGYSIPETPLPRPSSYGAGKDNDKEYNLSARMERNQTISGYFAEKRKGNDCAQTNGG